MALYGKLPLEGPAWDGRWGFPVGRGLLRGVGWNGFLEKASPVLPGPNAQTRRLAFLDLLKLMNELSLSNHELNSYSLWKG